MAIIATYGLTKIADAPDPIDMRCFLKGHKWRYDTPCHRTCLKCHLHQTKYKHVCDDRPGFSIVDCKYYAENIDRYKQDEAQQKREMEQCKYDNPEAI
jgi:hypothetical protein